ncbi:RecF/RecN/SMC family protein [Pseudomonas duriflava]|uniref:RecF/RecN/SMC family protein n=1 Tax=Pseudomonas duriflava TaxID=459528 RepID=A0A562PU94_9PSED|nr:AAA family ATPase [Pseudomonas duriflava]TWI48011.1 RecF/RecN/SMC family protein [Pseudomonas duriflava]
MKILSLSISNFMAIGRVESLPLNDKGLVLVQGENLDDTSQSSNGAGKSSITDALCWALYGETARHESGDGIVNRTAGKGTEVVVELQEASGDTYRISRYRKHRIFKNQLRLEQLHEGGWKDLTRGSDKLTQVLVDAVIGCSQDVFTSAVYIGQEAMPDLPGMTDRALKLLVEEAAGIDQLQKAYDLTRQRLSERKLEVGELTSQTEALRSAQHTFETNVAAAERDRDAWAHRHKAEIASARDAYESALRTFDPDKGLHLKTQLQAQEAQGQAIRDRIAASDEERRQERILASAHREAELALATAEQRIRDEQARSKRLLHALEHVDDKVGTRCAECGHVIESSDLNASREAALRAAQAQTAKADALKMELDTYRQAVQAAEEALAVYRAGMTDVSVQSTALGQLEADRNRLQAEQRRWCEQQAHLQHLQERLAHLEVATNPHEPAILRARQQLEQVQTRLKTLNERQATGQRQLELTEEAIRVFGPAGVRAHILDNVTPYLNARTAHYLSALTDGNITAVWSTLSLTAKGELRERFSIDVTSATGGETFRSLSGGEKRKVRLATAMALQDLVASRATKPIKLFMADEIDQALDEAGLERLMYLLEEKSHDKGTVLVISHSDLRDWIRNSITITKKGGQATLEAACLFMSSER